LQTALADFIRGTAEGTEAEAILRKCVHCGFCLATCPTYQLLGDELDSPRGRIYLVKQVLEGAEPTRRTQLHLDRCLTCRACEITCPSGVEYGRLADIGRGIVEASVRRSPWQRLKRRFIASAFRRTGTFSALLAVGRVVRTVLPQPLKSRIPPRTGAAGVWPAKRHARTMIVLTGCVQPAIDERINAATARVLDRIGISLVATPAGCCGALRFHMNYQEEGRDDMRLLIDGLWPHVEAGAEAFVMTASGCGATVREYGHLLAGDPRYAEKAKKIAAMTRDVSQVITAEWARIAPHVKKTGERVTFQAPCSLQHGQRLMGTVERVLVSAGFDLAPVPEPHLCCGSAGTYSLLQPDLSRQLRENKSAALMAGAPQRILTANIGCQAHLQPMLPLPVEHWIVALERLLR
jgi:glycolate oxidase iron-sulfur subunit